jgi:hypothetical protein
MQEILNNIEMDPKEVGDKDENYTDRAIAAGQRS